MKLLVSELKVGRCGETIVTKVLQFWEAHNGNKGCDLMGVYFTLVNEMVYLLTEALILYTKSKSYYFY